VPEECSVIDSDANIRFLAPSARSSAWCSIAGARSILQLKRGVTSVRTRGLQQKREMGATRHARGVMRTKSTLELKEGRNGRFGHKNRGCGFNSLEHERETKKKQDVDRSENSRGPEFIGNSSVREKGKDGDESGGSRQDYPGTNSDGLHLFDALHLFISSLGHHVDEGFFPVVILDCLDGGDAFVRELHAAITKLAHARSDGSHSELRRLETKKDAFIRDLEYQIALEGFNNYKRNI